MAIHIGGTIDIKRNWFDTQRTIDLHNGHRVNLRLLCVNVMIRDALKRHLNDQFERLGIGFIGTRLNVTTICRKQTACPLPQLKGVLTAAKIRHDFKIFVCQFGQRQDYEDYRRLYGPCVVKNQLNQWDVTINLKRLDDGIVMCQRRRYAG